MDTKRCPKCGETKRESDFGVNRAQPSGLSVYCLVCRRVYAKNRRASGKEGWCNSRYYTNPEMFKAHVFVGRAVKRGALVKPGVCPKCRIAGRKVEAHHHLGYAREHWLAVEWMCRGCHLALHRRL